MLTGRHAVPRVAASSFSGTVANEECAGKVMNHDELRITTVEVRQDSYTSHHAGSHHLHSSDTNARHPRGDANQRPLEAIREKSG